MSARQPFIPQARSPSAQLTKDGKFSSNMDRKTSDEDNDRADLALRSTSSEDLSFTNADHNPRNLNIQNLKKSDMHAASMTPFSPQSRVSSVDDSANSYPLAAKPFKLSMPQRGMKSVTSSPFFPSTASYQSIPAFRAPRVPSPTKRQSVASFDDVLDSPQAHTFTPGPILSNERLSGSTAKSHSSAGVVSCNDKDPETLMDPSKQFNEFGRANDEPPRDLDQEKLRHAQRYQPPPYVAGDEDNNEDGYTHLPLRRVNKRVERTQDPDLELEYSHTKRYKLDDERDMQSNHASCPTTPLPQYTSDHSLRRTPSPVGSHSGSMYASAIAGIARPVPTAVSVHNENTLSRLFGQDLDTYIDAHLSNYELAKKKWSDCTIDEWKAGAADLASKFSALLDFVKEHMSTKLSLYASFVDTLANHRKELAEREAALEEVRKTLIRNGGSVFQVKDTEDVPELGAIQAVGSQLATN